MTGYDLFTDPQAKASANRPLGGEERLEESLDGFLSDAGAAIGNCENDAEFPRRSASCFARADE